MDGAGSLGPFKKCLIVSNYSDQALFRKKYNQAHSVMEAFSWGGVYRALGKAPGQAFNSPSSSSSGFPSISQQHRLYRWNKGDPGYPHH
jgi:hypothetical protein